MSQLTEILIATAAVILPAVGAAAAAFLRAWTNAQIAKIDNDNLRSNVGMAKEAVDDAVRSVSQQLVPKIREAAADGKITPEERENLRHAALDSTRSAFSPKFWADLRAGLEHETEADLDGWLLDLIEARVFSMKK